MNNSQFSMTNDPSPVRLRIRFGKGEPLKYISHLDLARTWERVFRRARLPLVYSQGFNPRPRFQIAAALPVGVTGQAELLDLWLTEALTPEAVRTRLEPQLPPGLVVHAVEGAPLTAPSLQSQMRAATYRAVVHGDEPPAAIRTRVRALLAAASLPRRRQHKGKIQTYDLRPLIQTLTVEPGAEGGVHLIMRLQASPQGAGRPDQVLDLLGLSTAPHTIERTNLHFEFDN